MWKILFMQIKLRFHTIECFLNLIITTHETPHLPRLASLSQLNYHLAGSGF